MQFHMHCKESIWELQQFISYSNKLFHFQNQPVVDVISALIQDFQQAYSPQVSLSRDWPSENCLYFGLVSVHCALCQSHNSYFLLYSVPGVYCYQLLSAVTGFEIEFMIHPGKTWRLSRNPLRYIGCKIDSVFSDFRVKLLASLALPCSTVEHLAFKLEASGIS